MINYVSVPEIQVWNKDMEVLTSISGEVYTYFRFVRNYRTYDTFEFRINRNTPKAQYLLDDSALCLVFFDGHTVRAGIIEQIECAIDSTGSSSDEELIISGRSGGALSSRLTIAGTTTGTGYDKQSGKAETVMKHYVDVNCVHAVNGSNQLSAKRNIPHFVISSDNHSGETVSYSARYKVLSDVLESLSYAGGIGWEVTFDREERRFVFDVIEGTDHSEQSDSPVIFKPKLNNVNALEYLYSALGTKTYVYVAGQGENASRTIVPVYAGNTEPGGFERKEAFVDQRNTNDTAELRTSGMSVLADNSNGITLTAELNLASTSQQYQIDYDLGDIVTVDYEGIATLDVPIISVCDEIVGGTRGEIRKITVTFGTNPNDIRRMVKQSIQHKEEDLK